MTEITMNIKDRIIKWDVPDVVGVQLMQTFVQVMGPAKESDVESVEELEGLVPPPGVGTEKIRPETIEELKDLQNSFCAYGTREGDGKTCDCKYNPALDMMPFRGEVTGCPELRSAIRMLEAMVRSA